MYSHGISCLRTFARKIHEYLFVFLIIRLNLHVRTRITLIYSLTFTEINLLGTAELRVRDTALQSVTDNSLFYASTLQ